MPTLYKLRTFWKTTPSPVFENQEFNSIEEAWQHLLSLEPYQLHLLLRAEVFSYTPEYQIQLIHNNKDGDHIQVLPEIYESRYKAWEAVEKLTTIRSGYTDNLVSITILRLTNTSGSPSST